MVWERHEGPESVVERDVDPRVAESTNNWDRDSAEWLEADVLLPDRENHSSKTTRERGTSRAELSLAQRTDVGEKGVESGKEVFAVH